VLLVAGCGGDDKSTGSTEEQSGTSTTETTETTEQAPDLARESRPSRRDAEVTRELERHLRQEAVGVASGWRFADVDDVQVRGTRVAIVTRLRPTRREAAGSLCLAARRFFLQGGQGQTAYGVVVAGRDGSALGRC